MPNTHETSLAAETQKPAAPVPTPSELEAQRPTPTKEDTAADEESKNNGGEMPMDTKKIVVDWDGKDDPANPLNWSKTKRISQVVLISAITMLTLVDGLSISPTSSFH